MASTNKSKSFKTAVAYARFSSNNQREESIDAQLRAIHEYATKNHIEIIQEFTDEAVTGKTDNRDDFQRMISAILKGHIKIDTVLVHKFNRFARNKYDSALYKKRLKDIGVKVISVTQLIDDTPEGNMLESFLEAMDEYYSANLALEVQKGLRENALKGKAVGGKAVLGLSVDENGFYYPNEQAYIVKKIFTDYANGVPKTEICRQLNEQGLRNQYGRTFNTRTIYDMLRNEKYIGNYIYTLSHTETIRLEGIIKNPIIDYDLWERVKKSRSTPNKAKFRERKRYYHLTGKTTCAVCGCAFTGAGAKKQKDGSIYSYYKCVGKSKHKNGCNNTSLNKEWFEKNVLKSVVNAVFSEAAIDEVASLAYNELVAAREKPPVPTQTLQKQISAIAAKQAKLMELYLDGGMDKEMLNKKNDELKQQKNGLEKEIEKNEQLNKSYSTTKQDIKNYITNFISKLLEIKSYNDDEFMKAVFNTFVINVDVSITDVTVTIQADFSRLSGDNVRFGGAKHIIAPITIKESFARKTNVFGRNS